MSRIAPRLVSVWVGGDALEGYATAAPTSHLKVFLPAHGQTAPILPEYTPDGAVRAEAGPAPCSTNWISSVPLASSKRRGV